MRLCAVLLKNSLPPIMRSYLGLTTTASRCNNILSRRKHLALLNIRMSFRGSTHPQRPSHSCQRHLFDAPGRRRHRYGLYNDLPQWKHFQFLPGSWPSSLNILTTPAVLFSIVLDDIFIFFTKWHGRLKCRIHCALSRSISTHWRNGINMLTVVKFYAIEWFLSLWRQILDDNIA